MVPTGVSTCTVSPCAPRVFWTWMLSAMYMPATNTQTTASAPRINNATRSPASTPPVWDELRFIAFPPIRTLTRKSSLTIARKCLYAVQAVRLRSGSAARLLAGADRYGLAETNFHVRLILQVHRVDEAHAGGRKRHHNGLRANAVAKKPHTLQQIAIRDSASGTHE